MQSSVRFRDEHTPLLGKHWKFFLIWGAVLAILGAFAISAAAFTTVISIVVLGFLILASGIVIALDAFTYRRAGWQSFFLHLILATLYIVVGLLFIINPMNSSIYLTFWLGLLFIVIGAIRLIFASATRAPSWLWGVLNGFITLLLGIVILSNWPASSLIVVGIFVGVDLLCTGITYIMLAIAAHKFRKSVG